MWTGWGVKREDARGKKAINGLTLSALRPAVRFTVRMLVGGSSPRLPAALGTICFSLRKTLEKKKVDHSHSGGRVLDSWLALLLHFLIQ